MDVTELAARVASDGFAVMPDVLPAAAALELRGRLQELVDEDLARWSGNPHYRDHWMVHNLLLRDDRFLLLLENERLQACLDALLSPWCILYAYTSSSLPPHGSNYSRRIHNDAQARCAPYVTNIGVLLALDDFSEENGATRFLPGSHRSHAVPSEAEFQRDSVAVLPARGAAVFFNAHTFHLGGLNRTDQPRHAVSMNVCRHWMKQRFDYPRMLDARQLGLLGATGRRFVGMLSRPPVSLEEYYVAPELRTYHSGQS
jgi:ectoine hydroxylase-related dioxygenase (phytanoyl-CoA dioxygenase family)